MTAKERGVLPTAIDVTDSMEIHARAEDVFAVVQDYPGISSWYGGARCEYLNGATETAPGVEVSHRYGGLIPLSRFVRRIDAVEPGKKLEETYLRGDLLGRGIWTFEDLSSDPEQPRCRASYLCQVDASNGFMQLIFRMIGNQAHSGTYQKMLKSLKAHCENRAA